VLPRIWIALLALLLLAASAGGTVIEVVDAQSPAVQPSAAPCDDDDAANVHVLSAVRAPDRAVCAARRAHAVPPPPELARVFRPPRPPLA
jgi:hypothetical protein